MSPELHISLSNLQSNIQFFQRIIKKNTELSAVVKSDAYGLGIAKIVPEIERYGVRSFFTATISEAINIRNYSRDCEIFTLNGFDFLKSNLYREHNITPIINNILEAQKFIEIFNQTQKVAIQLNTGMNRLGLDKQSLLENIDIIKSLPLNLILSHLACADDTSNKENGTKRPIY